MRGRDYAMISAMNKEPFGNTELQFPLECQFRIIAENRAGMHFVIETVLIQEGLTSPLHTENISKGGRYQSFHADMRVESREQMNRIDAALRAIRGVRMVL